MKQTELKKSAIENNIKTIQKRIQELEQSFDSVNKELSIDEEENHLELQEILQREPVQIEKSFSKMNREQSENRSNFKRISKRREPEEDSPQNSDNYETRKMIEGLLREIDILRENEKQADVKIETMTFRCEKLQNELTIKLDSNNKLLMENEEKNGQIKNLLSQIKNLENLIDQNKKNFIPEFQRIKSQYDIAILEIRSLENDNNILENRIQDLTELNSQIRNDKREIDSRNRQIEIERLTLKREIEELKANFMNHENEFEDLNERYEKVLLENERLKNEILYLNQRNKMQLPEAEFAEESFNHFDASRNVKLDYIGGVEKKRENRKTDDLIFGDGRGEIDKRASRVADKKDRGDYSQNQGNRLLNTDMDRLNFDQLAQIEERFKKLNK